MTSYKAQQLDFSYCVLLLEWKITSYFYYFLQFLVISCYFSLFLVFSRSYMLEQAANMRTVQQ